MNPLKLLLPAGRAPRPVRTGLFRGIRQEFDLRGGEIQHWLGLYERETHAAVRRLLPGCRSGVDLGAARGELSILLLRQPGMARVVAVEPAATELAHFHANLGLNGLAGDPRLLVHAGFAGRGPAPDFRTLDELAAGLPGPLFLKVDIDGPEAEVLDSGRGILAGLDCRLLVETHSPGAEEGCIRVLHDCGYRTRIIHPAWWRRLRPEMRPIAHNRWLVAWRPDTIAA